MSLLAAFSSAILKKTEAKIDNSVFHLHYRLTAIILAAAAILVTSGEHFGKPITCGPAPPALSEQLLENYCWTRSTFSLLEPSQQHGKIGNKYAAYPGVKTASRGDPVFYHTYYQWVWLVLTLQAAMFYLPRYLWKTVEGGRIQCMSNGLTDPLGEGDGEGSEARRGILVKYIGSTWSRRNAWAVGLFACELLNFVNVVSQMFVMDSFLGGTFTTFGSRVLQYGFMEQEQRTDTMLVVFPRVTKCIFHAFGPSGNVQTHDAICVLPLNIINEKIYIVLWFWLIVLAVPTGIVLLYRILLICAPAVRVQTMHFFNSNVNYQKLNRVLRCGSVGDWLLLNLLAKNLDSLQFEKLVDDLDLEKTVY